MVYFTIGRYNYNPNLKDINDDKYKVEDFQDNKSAEIKMMAECINRNFPEDNHRNM
jgi:hypothetical protein